MCGGVAGRRWLFCAPTGVVSKTAPAASAIPPFPACRTLLNVMAPYAVHRCIDRALDAFARAMLQRIAHPARKRTFSCDGQGKVMAKAAPGGRVSEKTVLPAL